MHPPVRVRAYVRTTYLSRARARPCRVPTVVHRSFQLECRPRRVLRGRVTRQDGFGGFGANGTLSSSATEHQLASRLRVGGGGENGGPAQLRSANPLIERAIRGSHRQRTRTLGLGAPGDALFLKSNPNPDRAHREPPHPMQMGRWGWSLPTTSFICWVDAHDERAGSAGVGVQATWFCMNFLKRLSFSPSRPRAARRCHARGGERAVLRRVPS